MSQQQACWQDSSELEANQQLWAPELVIQECINETAPLLNLGRSTLGSALVFPKPMRSGFSVLSSKSY